MVLPDIPKAQVGGIQQSSRIARWWKLRKERRHQLRLVRLKYRADLAQIQYNAIANHGSPTVSEARSVYRLYEEAWLDILHEERINEIRR